MPEIVPLTTAPVVPFSLSAPIRLLARPTLTLEPEDSLSLASTRILQNGESLPVLAEGRVVGVITGKSLATALGDAAEFTDAVKDYIEQAQTIRAYATGAEALREFRDGATLVVVDDDFRLVGLISPADLYPKHRPRLRPPTLGGMATPIGVYLTAGSVVSGVKRLALVFAGAAMALIIYGSVTAAYFAAFWLVKNHLSAAVGQDIWVGLTFVLFCAIFRLSPIAGYHGAEHQVVHAIERELDLTPNIVRRMPRYHPRCGTNYSVAFALFLVVFSIEWTNAESLRLLCAIAVTLALWKPVGQLAQNYVTTKKPTSAQLDQAIRAGEELLDKYATVRTTYPTPWNWFKNSGLPFILIGLLAVGITLSTFAYLFKLDFLGQVL